MKHYRVDNGELRPAFLGTSARDHVQNAIEMVRNAHKFIRKCARLGEANDTVHVPREDGWKEAIKMDVAVELLALVDLRARFQGTVRGFGEESLTQSTLDLTDESRLCYLMDMLDGTIFAQMKNVLDLSSLWCSAIVIFDPREPRIVGSVVGTGRGEVFFCASDIAGTFVSRHPRTDLAPVRVGGPCRSVRLSDAQIYYYGQKKANLSSYWENLGSAITEPVRSYNFAGNPILVKVVDRKYGQRRQLSGPGVDAVVDVLGQDLHDAVPGLVIALKAGAFAYELHGETALHGEKLTEARLAELLVRPTTKIRYVLASSEELAAELLEVLEGPHLDDLTMVERPTEFEGSSSGSSSSSSKPR